jgi:hypothetical protein
VRTIDNATSLETSGLNWVSIVLLVGGSTHADDGTMLHELSSKPADNSLAVSVVRVAAIHAGILARHRTQSSASHASWRWSKSA